MTLSLIIPTLNAQDALRKNAHHFTALSDDIIVTDGGSRDDTLKLAIEIGARIAIGSSGRGRQLARAGVLANEDWFLFLHADTRLGGGYQVVIDNHMKTHPHKAGYFKFTLDTRGFRPRLMEILVALRCRIFALPYGDQGLLISRGLYQSIGGYDSALDLFEDVNMARKLGRKRMRPLNAKAITSATRYEHGGYFRRGLKNLNLLRRYLFGARQEDLSRSYYS